ncbi:dGTPase, partial [Aliarcobacter butzleri]
YEKAKSSEDPYQFNMIFTFVRVGLVTNFVNYVSKVFVQNHVAIFKGSFNYALLEFDKQCEYYKTLKILQDISSKY